MPSTPTSKYKLPPGPSFIVHQLLSWKTAGCVASVALIHTGVNAAGVHAPSWAIFAFSAITLPVVLYVQSELRYWRDKRTALALGATLAPKVSGEKPFGMDVITAILEAHDSGYIGAPRVS